MINSVTNTRTGNGTLLLGSRIRGKILSMKIVAGAVTASWVLTVTGSLTAMPILIDDDLSASTTQWRHPRAVPHKDTDGSAFTNVATDIYVLNEQIKCVITSAGTTKDVTITVFYDSDD